MLDNWQRIEQIIKWAGFASVSAFAREIGLNRSENLYQIKRGNNGISKDLAESIAFKFPEVSKAWLLTGEGSMLKNDVKYCSCDIPFFKEDAVKVVSAESPIEPIHFISFPIFDGCDFAAFTLSSAMEPDISPGTILFFNEVVPNTAIPGEIYLVISNDFIGIRYLRRDAKNKEVRLVPRNKSDFDEVIVPLNEVKRLYHVRGLTILKGY